MDGCSLSMTVSALACAISKGKSSDELALLSAFFVQLGDSLETIAAADAACGSKNEINPVIDV